ncbi:hypothetical protein CQR51_1308 [Bifidobacterium pseudolongum subsp. globosum]|nr:hypothetical protein CQR51_1308 [Bifidobacterium pseudolongum subsp. globosum]
MMCSVMWSMGSSPRLRGTRHMGTPLVFVFGIIPALAGNTFWTAWIVWAAWDHPRACGEHQQSVYERRVAEGSSPRLRGTLAAAAPTLAQQGIIPALAGNTTIPEDSTVEFRDHPRACGEHIERAQHRIWVQGSSSRLRGTLITPVMFHLAFGIIPALAGNTLIRPIDLPAFRDHPRACGEHDRCGWCRGLCVGSSPRLRGNTR